MSILITDTATIGDLRLVVDALGDGWGIEWTDTGIQLARAEVGVTLHPEAAEGLAAFLADVNPEPPRSPERPQDRPATPEQVARVVEAASPHACEHCGTAFGKAQGLRVHVARRHGPNADVPDRPRVDHDAARARAAEAL